MACLSMAVRQMPSRGRVGPGPSNARQVSRAAGASGGGLPTVALPDLPYDYGELEPHINAKIMELHHSKHHNTYVNNYNKALERYADAEQKGDVEGMIQAQNAIRFNGGGHVNHSLFWKNMCPPNNYEPPSGTVKELLDRDFGGLDTFREKFVAAAAGIQGSGWAWLAYNAESGRLSIATTQNQDPLSTLNLKPLLGLDCWEHAYYLQYGPAKAEYFNAFFNVINWGNVAENLEKAKSS